MEGKKMKKVSLFLMILLLLAGCASFQNSAVISTDAAGFATGQYNCNSSGRNGSFAIAGGGGGGSGGSGGGFGFGGMSVTSGPPPSEAYSFARSVATINYSTRLKSIKYDEAGGIIEYEFGPGPMSMRSDYSAPKSTKLPSAFGHQPIE
jgi:hypothetical protein